MRVNKFLMPFYNYLATKNKTPYRHYQVPLHSFKHLHSVITV